MRRALLLTLVVFLAPATAGASTRVVVRGAGFGHGTGMSQFGAYGFAKKGFGHQRILEHYYTGTKLGKAPSSPVRVLLQERDPFVRFRGATRGPAGRELDPTRVYLVRAAGQELALFDGQRRIGSFQSPLVVSHPGNPLRLLGKALNGVSSGLYRGSLELTPAGGGVTAVNSLPIDPYVQGVVPGEMPSGWDLAALRAQAVTARTYALATRKAVGVFDQYPDTRSQVYRGVSAETARTNTAVSDTAGQIVTYGGRPALTYYFSTSGGRTENVENSFAGSGPRPWLKSVEDPYDGISPKHRWRLSFGARQFGGRLGAPGAFRKIRVIKRGRSPRIVRARVYGARGARLLTGAQIRKRLRLYDSWAYFTKVSASQVKHRPRRAAATRTPFPEIRGSFDPAPRAGRVLVERRRGGRWERVAELLTGGGGRYRTTLAMAGVYRVRVGSLVGPRLRVR
jgi:stage II sporulation protein D